MPAARAVPVEAVERLLGLLTEQGVALSSCRPLFDPQVCAPHMRLYKLDVSVSLRQGAAARASVNDTGEPDRFRARMHAHRHLLGLTDAALQDFLGRCPPGVAQTTLSLKWETPMRTTLYFEELPRHPDAEGLRASILARYLSRMPPPQALPLMALAVDYRAGVPVAVKEYRHVDLHRAPSLVPEVALLLPRHPHTGEKRALLAQRYACSGARLGDKLLWVTEANTPALAARAWRQVARLVRTLGWQEAPGWARVRALVQSWSWGPDCVPYPDLVSFNRGADGRLEDLILYVSLK